jgi:peroxiredoxin
MDTLIEIKQPVADFTLPDLEGNPHALRDYRGRVVILNFWSAECPWVERADRELMDYLSRWGERVALLPIASNANESRELLARVAAERGLPLVLHDAEQKVAELFQVEVTPCFFVIDGEGVLRYRGAFDDVTFRQRTPTRKHLFEAVEAVLAGKSPEPAETPPYGCARVRY